MNERLETNTNDAIQLNRCDILPPIIVRTREHGDRMSLKGMQGTKKIKESLLTTKYQSMNEITGLLLRIVLIVLFGYQL